MTIDDGGPAFPFCTNGSEVEIYSGMTKRDLIAAMVLAGYRSNEGYEGSDDDYVAWAVGDADDLLAALANETEDEREHG